MFLNYLSYVISDYAPLPLLCHVDLLSIPPTTMLVSSLWDSVYAILFVWNFLLPDLYIANTFLSFRSQLKNHILRYDFAKDFPKFRPNLKYLFIISLFYFLSTWNKLYFFNYVLSPLKRKKKKKKNKSTMRAWPSFVFFISVTSHKTVPDFSSTLKCWMNEWLYRPGI